MNPEQLLQHFDRLSESPDALPRLRRFILDLAVRGKLVEQDPSDEPASELIKRIRAEKALLVKEGNIKKMEFQPDVDEDEIPFKLPKSWCWSRLGNALTKLTDGTCIGGNSQRDLLALQSC
jgi:type I restriction enzyme S subunit